MISPVFTWSPQNASSADWNQDLIIAARLVSAVVVRFPGDADLSVMIAWLDSLPSIAASGLWLDIANTAMVVEDIVKLLDRGVSKVVLSSAQLAHSLYERGVPQERFLLRSATLPDAIVAASWLAPLSSTSFEKQANVEYYEWRDLAAAPPVLSQLQTLDHSWKATLLVPSELYAFRENAAASSGKAVDFLEHYTCILKTDRVDGLYATVVVDERRVALGLVYSSRESLAAAARSGSGVYFSRSRQGLWVKGETSGAKQQLVCIDVDCDRDALQVVVRQEDPGFCHLNTRSCFGVSQGIGAMYKTLQSRREQPVPGSYTNKLFSDAALLHAKIQEEAGELCEATTKDDIAWETADVLYFTLAKCVQAGVSLEDVERHLDSRSLKITRRPGLAKPPKSEIPAPTPAPTTAPSDLSLRTYESSQITKSERAKLLQRPIMDVQTITSRVEPIMKDVRTRGDQALLDLTAKFDGVRLESPVLRAPFPAEILRQVPDHVRKAIDVAYSNIEKFHVAQLHADTSSSAASSNGGGRETNHLVVETMPGVVCSRFSRPIERVGLYVPGGSAVLPSTAMMLGIPAKVAGCERIVVATPPRKDGSLCPEVVYVADKIGAEMIVCAGGAQAVTAMAYGTESVPKVDKICGPGNQYVTAAKMIAQNDPSCLVSIDMPAGPSEVLVSIPFAEHQQDVSSLQVIADETCNPVFVASDLLSQAEHGPDSQVVLLTIRLSDATLAAIQEQVRVQTALLPRAEIVRVSIGKSFILRCGDEEEALAFSNEYAPEHLILHTANPRAMLDQVKNAGSVFLGPYSPESCGDYASGTNHTLPTYGYARMYSGVNTNTFLKHITAQELTVDGLNRLGDTVVTLAEVEELHGHRNAVLLRLKEIRGQ